MPKNQNQYEVEKFSRGTDGKWFARGARRFDSLEAASAYFANFVADQCGVLDNGTRIDLRIRKGRKVLATCGGRIDVEGAHAIRWL